MLITLLNLLRKCITKNICKKKNYTKEEVLTTNLRTYRSEASTFLMLPREVLNLNLKITFRGHAR